MVFELNNLFFLSTILNVYLYVCEWERDIETEREELGREKRLGSICVSTPVQGTQRTILDLY